MRGDKPFDSKAERKIGLKYSKEIERNIKANINSRFNKKTDGLRSIRVKPKLRKKKLQYLLIDAPSHAFVHNFGTNKSNKSKKEQVKSFTRKNRKSGNSRFSKGYNIVQPFSRTRKRNIKANRFIDEAITKQAMTGLADDITKLRADEVLTRVFN